MSNFIITTGQGTGLATILAGGGLAAVGKPFVQKLYLTSFEVAGVMYVDNISGLLREMKKGDPVRLVREPDNQYDKYAIRIENMAGNKMGYMPRSLNHIPARLMDAGKMIIGQVQEKTSFRTFRVEMYLED